MSRLVRKEIKAHNPNWVAKRMTKLVRKYYPGATISRPFVKTLADDPKNASFTLVKLVALDLYFRELGHSLKDEPIFEKRGLLECMVEPRRVTFMMGTKPRDEARTHDVSRWDTLSLAAVLSGGHATANEEGGKLDSEIEDVVLRERVDQSKFLSERWYQLLEHDEHSVVAFGSPHACLASEVMLARMFGVEPFSPPSLNFSGQTPFPFYFAWPKKYWNAPFSSFALDWRTLQNGELRDRLENDKSWAFILDNRPHYVDIQGAEWPMYGIVAAQRRTRKNVWVVLCGITGPATYAAAKLIGGLEVELPSPVNGRPGDVVWLPYLASTVDTASELKSDTEDGTRGDTRQVTAFKPLGEPRIFSPPRH